MKRHPGLLESVRRRTARTARRATRGAFGLWAWSNAGDLRSRERRGRETRAERRETRAERGRRTQQAREGSTLLVVLALLGMLSLLGVIYFSFANQEQQNATYFAEAARRLDDPGDDIDAIFDAAMKQLILGPDTSLKNSALWGNRHTMIATLFGTDLQPHSGGGVNFANPATQSGALVVDQNRDGVADPIVPDYDLREGNDSPAAHYPAATAGVSNPFERDMRRMPASDVDYTYPDHNNMLLASKSTMYIYDTTTTPPTPVAYTVLKPSFHRPELLRDANGSQLPDWAVHTQSSAFGAGPPISTKGRSFRPHPEHVYVWKAGQNSNQALERRFIIDASSNPGADPKLTTYVTADAALIGAGAGKVLKAFPFLVNRDGDAYISEQGLFSRQVDSMGNVVSAPAASDQYEFDVDNDNDGTYDGIWMDLDLPVLVRPSDNRTYIPLISMTVYDLDSLLNLNTVGNTSGDTRTSNTTSFGNGGPISVSSMGISPAEINPLLALDTNPALAGEVDATAMTDLSTYFGHAPASPLEMANMDYWLSLKGRVHYLTTPQIYAGRMGEADRTLAVVKASGAGTPPISFQQTASDMFPFPGYWYADDNNDANEGRQLYLGGNVTLPFVHPLALGGVGRFWSNVSFKQFDLFQPVAGSPVQWPRYTGFGVGASVDNNGNLTYVNADWLNYLGGQLMQNSLVGVNYAVPPYGQNSSQIVNMTGSKMQLFDDMLETTLEPKAIIRAIDEPFDETDALYLQLSVGDRNRTGAESRIVNTMPGNLVVPAGAGTPNQLAVAQRFTSLSWDLKHFGMPHAGYGPDGMPGRAGVDDDNDGNVDFIKVTINNVDYYYPDDKEIGANGSDDYARSWEFNVDADGDQRLEFPPQFNPVLRTQSTSNDPPYMPAHPGINSSATLNRYENAFGNNGLYAPQKHVEDPFRPQLRRLMSTEFGNTSETRLPKRLSVNQFLDIDRSVPQPNVFTTALQYRPLTPHSQTGNAVQNLPAGTSLSSYPPTAAGMYSVEEVKEAWARRDRQQMARDVYVLLYTFCGGNDSFNVTTTSGLTGYSTTMRRQMAQFAVNLVDSLDPDDVMTVFEFDNDLSNGWNLDDDPSTDEAGTMAAGERGIVFGIEAQQLTFSEVAWYRVPQKAADNAQTPFKETVGDFNFVQIELRSISPKPVDLADALSSSPQTGIWRILRDDNDDNVGQFNANIGENAVVFKNGVSQVQPGMLFTIASSDVDSLGNSNSAIQSAAMYVDWDVTSSTMDYELALPNKAGSYDGTNQPSTAVDLNLLHPNHSNYFALQVGGPGDFLSRNNNPANNSTSMNNLGNTKTTLKLERRLNPKLPQLSPDRTTAGDNLGPNPFITVDVYRRDAGSRGLNRQDVNLTPSTMSTMATQAQARIDLANTTASSERLQPLDARVAYSSNAPAPSPLPTSLTQNNTGAGTTGPFTLFVPHFDRDFASMIELFPILLRGPATLTQSVLESRLPPSLNPAIAGGSQGQLELGGSGVATFGAAVLLDTEDVNHNNTLDTEDANSNGVLDAGEDGTNGFPANNQLDSDDINGNGQLDAHPYHFHRLFSLMEVPTRTHRQLGDPLQVHRVPGRVNLNGVRDPRVLGGLIDDVSYTGAPAAIQRPERTGLDLNGNGTIDVGLLDGTGTDAARDWWDNFRFSRDGIDLTTGLPLPLGGTSRPFRDLGLLTSTIPQTGAAPTTSNAVLEDTIFRHLPISLTGRRLFELCNETEFTSNSPGAAAYVDPYMRHRILSKIYGNTTTRSNCFVVFMTIGMFECVELPNGAVRIGGQMDVDNDGSPDLHRAAFIVDRSVALEAYDKGSGTFDWKKLVLAKQRVN